MPTQYRELKDLPKAYVDFKQEVEQAFGLDISKLLTLAAAWLASQPNSWLPNHPAEMSTLAINLVPELRGQGLGFGEPLPEGVPREVAMTMVVYTLHDHLMSRKHTMAKLVEALRPMYDALEPLAELEPETTSFAEARRKHASYFRQDLPGVRRMQQCSDAVLALFRSLLPELRSLLELIVSLGQESASGLFGQAPTHPGLPRKRGRKPKDVLAEAAGQLRGFGFSDKEISELLDDLGPKERKTAPKMDGAAARVGERRRKRRQQKTTRKDP